MLSHKMDFNCCANRDGFRIDSHNLQFSKHGNIKETYKLYDITYAVSQLDLYIYVNQNPEPSNCNSYHAWQL